MATTLGFDPKAYLAEEEKPEKAFDPKAYLAEEEKPKPPALVTEKDKGFGTFNPMAGKAATQQKRREENVNPNEISFDNLYTNDKYFNTISQFLKDRQGEKAVEGKSKEDVAKDFMSYMRLSGGASERKIVGELSFLNSATPEQAQRTAEAREITDNVASFLSKKGQKGFAPVVDYLYGTMAPWESPTNWATMGAGYFTTAAIKKAAVDVGLKAALKQNLGKVALSPAISGVSSGISDVSLQKQELQIGIGVAEKQVQDLKNQWEQLSREDQIKNEKKFVAAYEKAVANLVEAKGKNVSAGQVAAATGVGAAADVLLGGIPALAASTATPKTLKGMLPPRTPLTPSTSPLPSGTAKPSSTTAGLEFMSGREIKETLKAEKDFDLFEGRAKLDLQGDQTDVAKMQVRQDVNKKAIDIAVNIWQQAPEFKPLKDERIGDAIRRTIRDVDTIDDQAFEQSLKDAGVSAADFARMMGTTASDAGKTLQQLSVVARMENKLKAIDPAAAKEIEELYGKSSIEGPFSLLWDGVKKLDRNLKAVMTSQLSTTIANAFSTANVYTFKAASELIESALYRTGQTLEEVSTGKPVTGTFKGGLEGVWKDATRGIFYLKNAGLSAEVTDELLKNSKGLSSLITRTVGENAPDEILKPIRLLNTLNTAQDAFFRKAMFAATVDKQLSRVGLDMYQLIADNKTIPTSVLKNATNEALRATMSGMPENTLLKGAVRAIEAAGPIGSVFAPFPKFMANALEWQMKHMPTSLGTGAVDIGRGINLLKSNEAEGRKLLLSGYDKVASGTVGTAALYTAIKIREENQDKKFYEVGSGDGSTVDTRVLFPWAGYLAIGDLYVKAKEQKLDQFDWKGFKDTVLGFKIPQGATAFGMDKLAEYVTNASEERGDVNQQERLAAAVGQFVGEYLGRGLVPLQQASAIFGAFDRDENIPRDFKQVPAGDEGFWTSMGKTLQSKTPILKQGLPEKVEATKKESEFDDSGLLKMFTAIRVQKTPNELERELNRLNVKSNKIFSSTGDPVIDAKAKEILAPQLLDKMYPALKNDKLFQQGNDDVKRSMMEDYLAKEQAAAKKAAISFDVDKQKEEGKQSRIFAIQYGKLSAPDQRRTSEMYKDFTGKDLSETKDYQGAMLIYQDVKSMTKPSSTKKFNEGGLASPRELSDNKTQNDEAAFQKWIRNTSWFKEFKAQYKEEPDLNTKDYDYRAAWKAGISPERDPYDKNRYHWPSSLPTGKMLKSADHPTAWKEYFMRDTGVNPDALGLKTPEEANIYLKNKGLGARR
jgi:hypothetical protein